MIALRHDIDGQPSQYFDLDDRASITLEAESPLFNYQAIPGLKVYRFNLPNSRRNRAILQFAGEITNRNAVRTLSNVHLEVLGLHFNQGTLNIEGSTAGSTVDAGPRSERYTVSFVSGAGDVAATLKETNLRDLLLGSETLNTNSFDGDATSRNYCLATVKNPAFYGDANPDYGGYVNYYSGNSFQQNVDSNEHTVTPFPFVLPVLQAIAELIGYRLAGDWLNQINSLCIYSNRALDQLDGAGLNSYQDTFPLVDQLPDMSCGAFLQALRSLFGLYLTFDVRKQQIGFHRLADAVPVQNYLNADYAASEDYTLSPYQPDGFRISMGVDSSDELYKRRSRRGTYFEIGAGELKIASAAGTLNMLTEDDPRNPGTDWTIPQVEQPGTSEAFDTENDIPLRLLWYGGLVGNYHRASPYGGPHDITFRQQYENNLYQTAWKDWILHVRNQPTVQTNLNLNLTDLLNLDFSRKILLKNTAYFLEKYRVSVSQRGLGATQVTLRKVSY